LLKNLLLYIQMAQLVVVESGTASDFNAPFVLAS
jgi:hypothetical protein